MNLDIFVDNEVSHLTEFYRWWKIGNAGNSHDFPMDLTPEQWGQAMSAYQLDEVVDLRPPVELGLGPGKDSKILDALFDTTDDIVGKVQRSAELEGAKEAERGFLRLVMGGS